MRKIQFVLILVLFFTSLINFAQEAPQAKSKVKISGKVIEKVSKQPLEYATITFKDPTNPKALSGGITNAKGEFDIAVLPGVYNITIEFISFKAIEIKQKNIEFLCKKFSNSEKICLVSWIAVHYNDS